MLSFTPRLIYPVEKVHAIYSTGGRVIPKAGLDTLEKNQIEPLGLPRITPLLVDRPAPRLVTTLTELTQLTIRHLNRL